MTIEEAIRKINAAKPGDAHGVFLDCAEQLSEVDRLMAAGDLEEMSLLIDDQADTTG